jgi:hypothetical protein
MRLRRVLIPLLTLAAMLPGPASASPGAAVVAGSGTISPGIAGPGAPASTNNVTFSGTAAGVVAGHSGTCSVNSSGSSTDTFDQGHGSETWTCSGPGWYVTCEMSWVRVGFTKVKQGTCMSNNVSYVVQGVCKTLPTSLPVMNSYVEECTYYWT